MSKDHPGEVTSGFRRARAAYEVVLTGRPRWIVRLQQNVFVAEERIPEGFAFAIRWRGRSEMAITMTAGALQGVPECPRCNRANPTFTGLGGFQAISLATQGQAIKSYVAALYKCNTCDQTVLAETASFDGAIKQQQYPAVRVLPEAQFVPEQITGKGHQFLVDALASLNAPTASIMASCSAIDAMLKDRGIKRFGADGKERRLYRRIEIAVAEGLLTKEMGRWAHKVRLDANHQRHADEDATLPTKDEARETFELARGLGEILFVLPAKAGQLEPDKSE